MGKEYPPTALETKDCPPHYWIIDSKNIGTCKKCGEVRDYTKLLHQDKRSTLYHNKASAGGKKNRKR